MPSLIVLPVSLLMNRFSLIIVYLKTSGFEPIEMLIGFANVKIYFMARYDNSISSTSKSNSSTGAESSAPLNISNFTNCCKSI